MNISIKNTVLLVSPDSSASVELSKQLIDCNFHVVTAASLEEALDLPKENTIDLIIIDMDVYLSERDFISVLNRKQQLLQTIPLIVVSSSEDISIKLRLFSLGVKDFIAKPFDTRELKARILMHISQSRAMACLERKNRDLEERNTCLEQMTITDAMTGLYNKRYILDRLCSEVSRSARYREPISFIMADIDYFKSINDRYGHQAGDKLLSEVALLLRTCIRTVDIPARYGGEEFLIVCPNTTTQGAKVVAERIRKKVQHTQFELNKTAVKVTLSIGIRSILLDPNSNINQVITKLIDEADKALYIAKSKGRNCVEVFKLHANSFPTRLRRSFFVRYQK